MYYCTNKLLLRVQRSRFCTETYKDINIYFNIIWRSSLDINCTMASSVLQLNLLKCSKVNTIRVLSIIHNETTTAFGTVKNKSVNLYHTRSVCYLTPKNVPQTNFHRKLYSDGIQHGLIPAIHRGYSTNQTNEEKRLLPTLMDFPKIIWPSLLKTIKNWITVNFIIRPYFDQEFNMPNFVNGTKHALQVSSWKR